MANEKVVVFTDGACKKNGSRSATGGIGVYWGESHPNNVSARVNVKGVTNNICELRAIETALDQILVAVSDVMDGFKYVVASDSLYAMSSLTTWYPGFIRRNWKSAAGSAIKNKDLIIAIKEKVDLLGNRVSFKYVKAHAGNAGNEAADRLASAACTLP